MDYRSTVKIMLEEKAYEMVKASINAFNDKQKKDYEDPMPYVFRPHEDKVTNDKVHILSWYDVKWSESFEDVQSVMNVLHDLNDKDKYLDMTGFAYKLIKIVKDGMVLEETNTHDSFGEDFYTYTGIVEPVTVGEVKWE